MTTFGWGTTGQFRHTITNPLGQPTNLSWDFERAVLSTLRDPNNPLTSDPKFTFEYDNFNRMTRALRPDGTATRWVIGPCGAPSYCGESVLRFYVEERDRNTSDQPINQRIVYFDMLGREKYDEVQTLNGSLAVIHTVYDSLGRVATHSLPYLAGSSDPYKVTTYSYDQLNRVTQVQRQVSESDLSLLSEQWTYNGLSITHTDEMSRQTTQKLSALGQEVQWIDAAGNDTEYEYDPFGNLVKIRDVVGNEIILGYNIRGMKTTSIDPDMGNWSYDYYPLGELKSQTDANGRTVTFDPYDALSRPVKRTELEGVTNWTWGASDSANNIGQLYYVASPGYSETHSYDTFGRPTQSAIAADGTTYYLDQSYDAATGLPDTLTYPTSTGPSRFKVKYGYQNGHLKTVNDYTADILGPTLWEAISQDARGNVFDEQLGNGLRTYSKYDFLAGYLDLRQTGPGGGTSVQNLNYDWDKVGNLTKRQDLNQSATENFVYDTLDRLDFTTGVSSLDVGYDAIGNITAKNDVGSFVYTGSQSGCSYYAHAQPHAVRKVNTTVYCYDANGNMTSRGGANVSWYSYNLPNVINQAGGSSSQFWYGADRQRFKQVNVDGATTTTTIYVGGLLEKVTVAGINNYKHFVPTGGDAVLVHVRSTGGGSTTYYLVKDHLGSVDKITNSTGGLTVALSYDAFGKRRGPSWTGNPSSGDLTQIGATTRHGFTEHEHLDNLALTHMNGRVYDPAIGRFIQADPFIPAPFDGQSLNRYSYVFNNPLSFTDPSGFCGATAINIFITQWGRRHGENFGSNQPSFNVPCPDLWWTGMNPGAMSRGGDHRGWISAASLPSVFAASTASAIVVAANQLQTNLAGSIFAAAGAQTISGIRPDGYVNLGSGYVFRKDEIPGTDLFEIHVYENTEEFRKQVNAGNITRLQKFEKGVVGPDGSWLKKHGHTSIPKLPQSVDNRLRGIVVNEARRRGWLGAKGTVLIKGKNLQEAIMTGMRKTGSLKYLGKLGGTLGIVGGVQSMLSIEQTCQLDPDFEAC